MGASTRGVETRTVTPTPESAEPELCTAGSACAPPETPKNLLDIGSRIQVRWKANHRWYPAKLVGRRAETVEVFFDDGIEAIVFDHEIRPMTRKRVTWAPGVKSASWATPRRKPTRKRARPIAQAEEALTELDCEPPSAAVRRLFFAALDNLADFEPPTKRPHAVCSATPSKFDISQALARGDEVDDAAHALLDLFSSSAQFTSPAAIAAL